MNDLFNSLRFIQLHSIAASLIANIFQSYITVRESFAHKLNILYMNNMIND